MSNQYVVLDLETTGHNPKNGDRIIQVAALLMADGEVLARFSTFVNPKAEIPTFIEQLTHINNEMVQHAPTFEEIASSLVEFIGDAYFVAHNVHFDFSFLNQELQRIGFRPLTNKLIDTVELSRILLPTNEGYKLQQLSTHFNMEHDNPHQADSDAEATGDLLLLLLDKIKELPKETLTWLSRFAPSYKSAIGELFNQGLKEAVRAQEREELEIIQDLPIKKAVVKNVDNDMDLSYETFYKKREELFKGVLKKYESRSAQWSMMETVYEALTTSQHAIIEAGTGTGKTLAYLIPAIFVAKEKKQPVVVSTHTVNLQQQLIDQNAPLLEELVSFPVSVTLLKGRHHYLNVRKFLSFLPKKESNYDIVLAKSAIVVWLTMTTTGDIDELNLPSGGKLFWEQINDEQPLPIDFQEPWQRFSFYERAQNRAKDSDIIVTNHRLLLLDVMRKQKFLPQYDSVIIDEAHHLEEIASEQLGTQLDYFQIHHLLLKIGTNDTEGYLKDVGEYMTGRKSWFIKLDGNVRQVRAEMDDLFRLIHRYVRRSMQHEQATTRVRKRYEVEKAPSAIKESCLRTLFLLEDFERIYLIFKQEGEKQQWDPVSKQYEKWHNLIACCEELLLIRDKLHTLLLSEKEGEVCWVEIEAKGAANAAFLYNQPADVSEALADLFFAHKKSVVLTSATLTIKEAFDYTIERLGLYDFQPLQLKVESPFHYKEQARLFIPDDLPAVNETDLDDYCLSLAHSILQVARVTNGKMLVLFTSYEMLKKTFHYTKDLDFEERFMVFGQGISTRNRTRLVKDFVQFDQSILFGTSSFWEGVDIPGEALSCLAIVRLPFAPPHDPVVAAKMDRIKKLGRNAFTEQALPDAIIRFKQGFGRLIRTKRDKGAIVIFDRRIIESPYGKQFIKSIPEVDVVYKPFDEMIEGLEEWWDPSE
ncbi:ATP-dependent DNA helicase DinG [Priestia endophytica]|uniref:3'-5' exonuclease DinG n=1 Tax=Priestia endophytica TaxID=135735 RepID=A0AAX1Q273_9BACI|nr:ATP-dependent DNA helicase DinG [Priestia endophytica]RAS72069.1 ATP-dependent helicase DinG [Priestia endophytica]RAS89704.1 ATP-dependent helicase DinG [Priestia endophytica]